VNTDVSASVLWETSVNPCSTMRWIDSPNNQGNQKTSCLQQAAGSTMLKRHGCREKVRATSLHTQAAAASSKQAASSSGHQHQATQKLHNNGNRRSKARGATQIPFWELSVYHQLPQTKGQSSSSSSSSRSKQSISNCKKYDVEVPCSSQEVPCRWPHRDTAAFEISLTQRQAVNGMRLQEAPEQLQQLLRSGPFHTRPILQPSLHELTEAMFTGEVKVPALAALSSCPGIIVQGECKRYNAHRKCVGYKGVKGQAVLMQLWSPICCRSTDQPVVSPPHSCRSKIHDLPADPLSRAVSPVRCLGAPLQIREATPLPR